MSTRANLLLYSYVQASNMPLTKHRLNCCICPQPPERIVEPKQYNALLALWEEKGWISEDRGVSNAIVRNGFSRVFVDSVDRILFFANHQGGYRVRCAKCSENIVRPFSVQLQNWRAGAPRHFECPYCRAVYPLEDCSFRPPAAFSSSALVLCDVAEAEISQPAKHDLQEYFGVCKIIYKRMG